MQSLIQTHKTMDSELIESVDFARESMGNVQYVRASTLLLDSDMEEARELGWVAFQHNDEKFLATLDTPVHPESEAIRSTQGTVLGTIVTKGG